MTSNAVLPVRSASGGQLAAQVPALRRRFPARSVPERWAATCEDQQTILARLLAPPFRLDRPSAQHQRRFGLTRVLEWLEAQPAFRQLRKCRRTFDPAVIYQKYYEALLPTLAPQLPKPS